MEEGGETAAAAGEGGDGVGVGREAGSRATGVLRGKSEEVWRSAGGGRGAQNCFSCATGGAEVDNGLRDNDRGGA